MRMICKSWILPFWIKIDKVLLINIKEVKAKAEFWESLK
jgi:hypothetical protein